MKFLIVDDEERMRAALRDALERVCPGSDCVFADCFETAVRIFDEEAIDVVFFEVQIAGENGFLLAQALRQKNPRVNLVVVSARSEYALEALQLFVSGYLLKPVADDELRAVLQNLRYPPRQQTPKKLEVRCFGSFEVLLDGKPVAFQRKKAKELMAYLVSLKGAFAGRAEICDALFEENGDTAQAFSYFRTLVFYLRRELRRLNAEDVLLHCNNAYAVDTSRLSCDYYDYLIGHSRGNPGFTGEFMRQYSWAERYIWELEHGSKSV